MLSEQSLNRRVKSQANCQPKLRADADEPMAGHRPQASFFGRAAYPTLAGKAAALMHSLAGNHAPVDGNKRLALLATAVFLRISGCALDLTDDEASP